MKTVNELKAMNVAELKQEHLALLREQFNLRMQKGYGESSRPHSFRQVRRNIARVLTILNEKQVKQDD